MSLTSDVVKSHAQFNYFQCPPGANQVLNHLKSVLTVINIGSNGIDIPN